MDDYIGFNIANPSFGFLLGGDGFDYGCGSIFGDSDKKESSGGDGNGRGECSANWGDGYGCKNNIFR